VIDVTNFSAKTISQGSRENLHLVERWTRTGPTSLEYVVTAEDQPCGRGRGPPSKSSPGKATARTDFIMNRAALRETMVSRGIIMVVVWKSAPLWRTRP